MPARSGTAIRQRGIQVRHGAQRLPGLPGGQGAGPSQRLLVPADGEGRNGAWLAARDTKSGSSSSRRGHRESQAARHPGEQRCLPHALAANDLTRWTPPSQPFDGVVLCFVHLDSPSWHAALQRCWQAPQAWRTAADGVVPRRAAGTPQRRSRGCRLAATLDGLRRSVSDLGLDTEEWLAETCATVLDEGPGHQGGPGW